MDKIYQRFYELLEREDKPAAVGYALSLLEEGQTDVVSLYTKILSPALNQIVCSLKDRNLCVWKEHVRSAIVRTIVECCYPYVLQERTRRGGEGRGSAAVMCPPGEYHDLGARMVADFFTLLGYETVFVGSNTPYGDFLAAADTIRPDIIAISISNYYNLVVTRRIIDELRKTIRHPFRIVIGGSAVADRPENAALLAADHTANTFEDLENIAKGGEIL